MTLNNLLNEKTLRAVFSWLTKLGVAPKFGTCPIGYYQLEQFKAIETLETALQKHGFTRTAKFKSQYGGLIYAQESTGKPWKAIARIASGQIEII